MTSPAMSLLKTTESPTPRSSVPVSWSPLVKTITSGAGLAGDWAAARGWRMARLDASKRGIRMVANELREPGWGRRLVIRLLPIRHQGY